MWQHFSVILGHLHCNWSLKRACFVPKWTISPSSSSGTSDTCKGELHTFVDWLLFFPPWETKKFLELQIFTKYLLCLLIYHKWHLWFSLFNNFYSVTSNVFSCIFISQKINIYVISLWSIFISINKSVWFLLPNLFVTIPNQRKAIWHYWASKI